MRRAERHSVVWFLAVGGLAGLVHYVTTLGLNTLAAVRPGPANIVGFLCAFPVSYYGHRSLSFSATAIPHGRALPRLFAVSSLAFAANQALLLTILSLTALPLSIALAVVLLVVAVSTYLLSRGWVFARRASLPHDTPDPER
jgi:putative flippase GtrA